MCDACSPAENSTVYKYQDTSFQEALNIIMAQILKSQLKYIVYMCSPYLWRIHFDIWQN